MGLSGPGRFTVGMKWITPRASGSQFPHCPGPQANPTQHVGQTNPTASQTNPTLDMSLLQQWHMEIPWIPMEIAGGAQTPRGRARTVTPPSSEYLQKVPLSLSQ